MSEAIADSGVQNNITPPVEPIAEPSLHDPVNPSGEKPEVAEPSKEPVVLNAEPAKPGEVANDVKPEEAKPEGAPEAYATFTTPEGMTMSEKYVDSIKEVARELNLPQEAAQKLYDAGINGFKEAEEKSLESWKTARADWVARAKKDPDFGGSNYQENKDRVIRLMNKFADTDTVTFLETTGFGDNPGFLNMMRRIESKFSEDTFIEGSKPEGSPLTQGERLYGKNK